MENFHKIQIISLILFSHIGLEISINAPVISLYPDLSKNGYRWSPDDQCRQIYPNGSFCHVSLFRIQYFILNINLIDSN
jgi:hypothetical protein